MENYLLTLISRMNDASDPKMLAGFKSSETTAWKALREAEKLCNPDFIAPLIEFICTEKNKKIRDKAYFALGHLAKNINSQVALNFLISSTAKETDKYIVASIFDRIAHIEKPIGTNLQPIINATKSDKWLIRHSAISALNLSLDETAEMTLTNILNSSDDPYNLIYANAVLNKIGTLKAIPYLEKQLSSRKNDVKDSAKFAIEEIRKRLI